MFVDGGHLNIKQISHHFLRQSKYPVLVTDFNGIRMYLLFKDQKLSRATPYFQIFFHVFPPFAAQNHQFFTLPLYHTNVKNQDFSIHSLQAEFENTLAKE